MITALPHGVIEKCRGNFPPVDTSPMRSNNPSSNTLKIASELSPRFEII